MSAGAGACRGCLLRGRLLAELLGPLDRLARNRTRLLDALELPDEELVAALGGRRRAELLGLLRERLEPEAGPAVCVHAHGYPDDLTGSHAPRSLHLAGGSASRLLDLLCRPRVAILGSTAAGEAGIETARSLGRGLSAAGVTVAAPLAGGIGAAALAGAAGAGAVAVLADGPQAPLRGRLRGVLAAVARDGSAIAELPGTTRGRSFGPLAAARVASALGSVVVVVEARPDRAELELARRAGARGAALGAVPGPVASPLSDGPHELLRAGATLVCGPEDVLELLPVKPPRAPGTRAAPLLEPALAALLERVAAGDDTPPVLCRAPPEGMGHPQVLLGLTRLELTGLLRRGPGGRYVVTGC